MRKTFLSPGWVIAAILIALFSYFAFTFLAPWQLGKNERLVERNEHIVEAFEHDPVPYSSVAPGGAVPPEDEWTRVTMTGHYLPEDEVLLRLRPVDKTPAFQVLTPFAVDGGPTFLVNRGWVPAADGGTTVPDFAPAPTNQVTITGMLRLDEGPHPSAPVTDQGHAMIYSISTDQASEITGADLAPSYLQLAAGEPGVLEAIPLPMLETGNHLSYGLQWIAFGIMAPAGLIYFLWAEVRERRRFRQEQEELLADAPTSAPPEPATASPSAPARGRYGRTKRNPWASAYDREQER
ncbi:SURF1 family protein [Corynebacterium qintianiae]|uniref:SURF1-like protein n=1 Tax=Corynebacterium qintianiae TaxID=2709392 RepID=A0A7T0KLK0_9CORY|nr:SURF1 family cytochrome oxidase biogenesis protein [Corynebacterium qintianiae]QPK82747.1 SURF1 family protein [Corynebacterium qintianiae]